MIRLFLRLFLPGCSRPDKVQYGSRESAERAVAAMARKGSPGLEPYWCPDCEAWHIGHGGD